MLSSAQWPELKSLVKTCRFKAKTSHRISRTLSDIL
jgi:hypothetical protein